MNEFLIQYVARQFVSNQNSKSVSPKQKTEKKDSDVVHRVQQEIISRLNSAFGPQETYQRVPPEKVPLSLDLVSKGDFLEKFNETNSLSDELKQALCVTNFAPGLQQQVYQSSQQTQELNLAYRQKAIMRYKQKKQRMANKIAYECRKVVADSRPRLKGRFISKEEQEKIQLLLNGNSIDSLLDGKKNINIKKFLARTKLFCKEKISNKNVNKQIVHQLVDNKHKIQNRILERIGSRLQVFQIENR